MCDMLQGLWWKDDSQIRSFGPNEEILCCEFKGFLAVGGVL